MDISLTILLALAVFGLFVFAISVSRPEFGLAALVFVVYTNLSEVLITQFGLPSVTQPLVALLAGIIVARRVLFQDNIDGWQYLTALLVLYSFLGYLSVFYALDRDLATETLLYYLKNAVIGLVVIFLFQKKAHVSWVIWTIIAAGAIMGSISTYQALTDTYTNIYWGFGNVLYDGGGAYRIEGPIGDPNYYAQIMVTIVPLAIERLLHEKRVFLRFFSGYAVFVVIAAIFYTNSRGGFLALVLVGFLIFIRLPTQRFSGFILLSAVLVISYKYIPQAYLQRVSTLVQVTSNTNSSVRLDDSIMERRNANIIGWTMFMEHPVFGVGAGNFNSNLEAYSRKLGLRNNVTSAHNLYLEVAAERGVVGFFCFMLIIYSTFKALINSRRAFLKKGMSDMVSLCDALTISLISYLVTSVFLHDAQIRYFWLLLGIAWSLPQVVISSYGRLANTSEVRVSKAPYFESYVK